MKSNQSSTAILSVYVDNIIITGESTTTISEIKAYLSLVFDIKYFSPSK